MSLGSASAASLRIHPLIVRVSHWLNALAILIMIFSGWRIYDASPIFPFEFPDYLTLGGWLAGALQWHFAAMWLLVVNGLIYVLYGVLSGHYRRSFFPLRLDAILHEFANLLHGRVSHALGSYNPIQRLAYLIVILLGITLVLSGMAIWKPVQFQELAGLMGGYDSARVVHFIAMAGVVGFIVVHLLMVALVPRTLPPMFTGRLPRSAQPVDGAEH
ncbi:MAG TPA: cytochrome b/b6 domain-containing protein [Thiobacillaceae bacterium]|nr:cytochrome b/b6 domain-containing protein [Thiobacillaceae bacterium]